jgi:hypothetical protein
VQLFLRPDTRADDPERFGNFPGNDRDEKSARRLDHMGKGNRTSAAPQRLHLARDWRGRRDDFQKLDTAGFFHVIFSPKGDRSSICRGRASLQWWGLVGDELRQLTLGDFRARIGQGAVTIAPHLQEFAIPRDIRFEGGDGLS